MLAGMSTVHPPLRHLALAVRDPDRSARFYSSLFGFHPVRWSPDGVLMLTGPDGFSLALGPTDEAVALPPFLHFGFRAASPAAVQAHRGEIAGRGAEIVEQCDEPGYISLKCRDPDGYVVEVAWEPQP
jgi:catechol 2,3-dioxygenase-like lactoylglutathione lyase family enzyme